MVKQFLKNIARPVAISGGYVALCFLSGIVGEMLGLPYWEAFLRGSFTLTLFSVTGFLVWLEWGRAREKVKEENDNIVRALKDE